VDYGIGYGKLGIWLERRLCGVVLDFLRAERGEGCVG